MYVANWMQTDPAGMQSMIDSYYGAQRPRPAGAQGQGDVEQDAMDQIQAFYKGGKQPQSPQAQPAGQPPGGGAGWAGFKGYSPQAAAPGNGALGLRPGELGDVTSGGGQIGVDNTPTQPVGVQVGNWRTASPAQVLSPAGQASGAGGARPGYMTGSEFATAMNGGMLRDPSNINLKDMERYILHGNGQLTGVSPAQRAGVVQAFMGMNKGAEGMMAQDTARMLGLGTLGVSQQQENRLGQEMQYKQDPRRLAEGLLLQKYAPGSTAAASMDIPYILRQYQQSLSQLPGHAPASQVTSNVSEGQFAANRNAGAGNGPAAPAVTPAAPRAEPALAFSPEQREAFEAVKADNIGQFLWRLNNQTGDGGQYIKQNLPAIRSYLAGRFGDAAWNRAAKGTNDYGQLPVGSYTNDWLLPPGIGTGAVSNTAAMVLGGAARRANPWVQIGASVANVAGMYPRVLDAVRSRIGMPSEQIQGNEALAALLADLERTKQPR